MFPPMLSSIESRINLPEEQIEAIESEIESHIDNTPKLRKQRKLFVSIPGIGEPTANALLAEIPDIHRFSSVRKMVAYAGFVLSERSSVTLRGQTRLSKVGSTRIRKRLFFQPFLGSAITHL